MSERTIAERERDSFELWAEQMDAGHPGPNGETSDYMRFRGKCKELSEAAVAADPSLTLVRGHYFCPIWNTEEPHWWTVRADGSIHDPTARQFPSAGYGIYTPFSGVFDCAQCGKEVPEEEAYCESNYAFCNGECFARFVGVA
jgi:hypothetical protein